jgi:hypothetical protein
MKTSSVAAETIERKLAFKLPEALASQIQRLSMRTRLIAFFALCALVIVVTRWGYAFAVPPHTPVYANFDIGFQYLYADYFRDHGTFPSTPADISQGAPDGYFWWWWDNEYFSKYLGLAAAIVGAFMWLGVPFVPSYAIVTWLADMSIAALAYRLVAGAAGRRAGVIAALLVSVHPLYVWGMYQAQVQISVGVAFFLGVMACWRWWSDHRRRMALFLAAVFALAASLAHAFFLSMLLGAFLPAVALYTLWFQRNRAAVIRQAAFALAVTAGLLANTRLWLNFETYSEATKSLIGRADGWGQLPSPLFLLGLSSRVDSWRFGPAWLVFAGFVAALAFATIQSFRERDVEPHRRALMVVLSVAFVLDLVYMIGAHQIRYDYWILRHAQYHTVAAILPASIGLSWLMRSPRLGWRAGAWALAGTLVLGCFAVSFKQLFVKRSHGAAFARFLADEQRPKLPYMVVLYPGGTALTPFTCALTETPAYDLHPDSIPSLVGHLERHYGWKRGDEANVLWYSAVSPISRDDMHFTEILGEWSTAGETVVLGKAHLDLGHGTEPPVTPNDGWVLIDRLDFADRTSEVAHQYRVDAPVFKGTATFMRHNDQTVQVRNNHATKSFEEFRMKVAPGSDHALVKGFDTVSSGQFAQVIVDGGAVLQWDVGTGPERYAESSLSIPASAIGSKDEVTLRVEYVAGSLGINSFGYWMFSKPTSGISHPLLTDTEGYALADRIDVGEPSDEAAHDYVIVEPTFSGQQVFALPEKGTSYLENGRATKDSERFRVRATPGHDHLLIKAYDNFSKDQRLRVAVDGEPVGVWELPSRDERYGEAAFVIPAAFMRRESVVIRVRLLSASLDQNSFVYWLYAKAPASAQGRATRSGQSEERAVQALRPRSVPF